MSRLNIPLLCILFAICAGCDALSGFRRFRPWRDHEGGQVNLYAEKTLVISWREHSTGKVHGSYFHLETNMSNSNIIFAHRVCHPYTVGQWQGRLAIISDACPFAAGGVNATLLVGSRRISLPFSNVSIIKFDPFRQSLWTYRAGDDDSTLTSYALGSGGEMVQRKAFRIRGLVDFFVTNDILFYTTITNHYYMGRSMEGADYQFLGDVYHGAISDYYIYEGIADHRHTPEEKVGAGYAGVLFYAFIAAFLGFTGMTCAVCIRRFCFFKR
jgi:hypothetical protein